MAQAFHDAISFTDAPVIGRLFDTVGRKPTIVLTYGTAGILLATGGWLSREGSLTATTQVMAWTAIVFIAPSAASAACLTASGIFSLAVRDMAVAVSSAAGTPVGGDGAPAHYGAGSREPLFWGQSRAACW